MEFLSRLFKSLLRAALFLALFVMAIVIYEAVSQAYFYSQKTGTVKELKLLCHLEKKKRGHRRMRRTVRTPKDDCDKVRKTKAEDEEFRHYRVRQTTNLKVSYSYGGETYLSPLVQARRSDGTAIEIGDRLSVLVEDKRPQKIISNRKRAGEWMANRWEDVKGISVDLWEWGWEKVSSIQ